MEWNNDHDGAVNFSVGAPDPFGTLGYASKKNAFAVQQLALFIGAANDQIVATGVTVRNDAACVEVQRSLRSNLHSTIISITVTSSVLFFRIISPIQISYYHYYLVKSLKAHFCNELLIVLQLGETISVI